MLNVSIDIDSGLDATCYSLQKADIPAVPSRNGFGSSHRMLFMTGHPQMPNRWDISQPRRPQDPAEDPLGLKAQRIRMRYLTKIQCLISTGQVLSFEVDSFLFECQVRRILGGSFCAEGADGNKDPRIS